MPFLLPCFAWSRLESSEPRGDQMVTRKLSYLDQTGSDSVLPFSCCLCIMDSIGGKMTRHKELIENIREQPAYSMKEASRYLGIPYPTLRDWVRGFPRSHQKPIIYLPDGSQNFLSFINLIEIHVLDAIRRDHGISFPKIRTALEFLSKSHPSKHPLAENLFSTDGLHLFIKEYGKLVRISSDCQVIMENVLKAYLKRIEWDEQGIPIKLYPFIRKNTLEEPKGISIDPTVSFGRPVLVGTGIPTSVIHERFMAGDSTQSIATDYQVDQEKVEDAIRCEQETKAA